MTCKCGKNLTEKKEVCFECKQEYKRQASKHYYNFKVGRKCECDICYLSVLESTSL